MVFNVALFSSLLLVPAVLVVPSALGASVAQSQVNSRQAVQPISSFPDGWAGAIMTNDNGNFNLIIGTFTVPSLSGSAAASASAWVGISGTSCSSILRTGVAFTMSSNGQPEYDAWYEWYPGLTNLFSGITISAGDVISLSVMVLASSRTSGQARIVNVTNGKMAEQTLTSNTPLCGQSAEWIVEDYDYLHSTDLVPFADFGNVTFTGAVAAGTGGSGYYAASQGSLTDVEKNGQVLTSTSVSSEFSITIKYAGPEEQAIT